MRFVLLVLVVAACGGHGECPPGQFCVAPPDIREGDQRCAQIQADLDDAVSDRGSCIVDSDCRLLGGQFDFPTCNCAPFAIDCSGIAIGRNAPRLAQATALIEELSQCDRDCTSGTLACVCDCAPATDAVCDQGRCSAIVPDSCLPPNPPDAGMF